MRLKWDGAVSHINMAYGELIDMGMPAEDARGLLPTNILTRLHYSTDLRALLDHAGNRLCTQAQFEWRLVFAKIVEAIRNKSVDINDASGSSVVDANGTTRVYMAEELTSLFKPVCYQTGKCEFKANFDRACSIRERVDLFEAHSVPSSEWGEGFLEGMPGNQARGMAAGPWSRSMTDRRKVVLRVGRSRLAIMYCWPLRRTRLGFHRRGKGSWSAGTGLCVLNYTRRMK